MTNSPKAVVFDMGGVLADWNPDYLYRKLITDEAERRHFLNDICTMEWHNAHDAGISFAENAKPLLDKYPDPKMQALIRAWGERFDDMIRGSFEGTVAIVRELAEHKVPLFGLTNWPAESWLKTGRHFDFMRYFRDVIVSGTEKTRKPGTKIFEILLRRSGYAPPDLVFIDDREENLVPPRAMGMHTLRFTSPADLRLSLHALGLL